jgi:hypothetical protein
MNEIETMTGRVIVGPDGATIRGTFPKSWGRPPDDLDERKRWMRSHIQEGERRMDAGETVEGQKPRTAKQMLASLNRRRESPAFANHYRERLLALSKEGPQ